MKRQITSLAIAVAILSTPIMAANIIDDESLLHQKVSVSLNNTDINIIKISDDNKLEERKVSAPWICMWKKSCPDWYRGPTNRK